MFENSRWKTLARCNKFYRAKFWQNISRGQVKIFTYLVIGLLVFVAALQVALFELDRRQATKIEQDRNSYVERSQGRGTQANDTTTKDKRIFQYASEYSNAQPPETQDPSKSGSIVKRQVSPVRLGYATKSEPEPSSQLENNLERIDPFEVSESQFVVYRQHRTLQEPASSLNNLTATATTTVAAATDQLATPTLATSSGLVAATESYAPSFSNHKPLNDRESTNGGDQQGQEADLQIDGATEVPEKSLVSAASVGAIAGTLIGDHILNQFEERNDEPTATGTNRHWAGPPEDSPQSESDKDRDRDPEIESENADQQSRASPAESRKQQSDQPSAEPDNDGDPMAGASFESMPDSIESLMGSSDEKADGQNEDSGPGGQTQSIQARSNLINDETSNSPEESSPMGESDMSDYDSDRESEPASDESDRQPNDLAQVGRLPVQENVKSMQGSGTSFNRQDLNTAAGHHYGKKKKKKIIVIKKKKKKVKKKKKKKKVIIIKKKKIKKKKKKKPIKKYKKKKHYHGKADHGKYYMYAKVPKKKSWEFGFKKGNKKHWIERHEKGHKNKFKTKVKWFDKKSKGKGVHIWDYNHHDKKKKYHG